MTLLYSAEQCDVKQKQMPKKQFVHVLIKQAQVMISAIESYNFTEVTH